MTRITSICMQLECAIALCSLPRQLGWQSQRRVIAPSPARPAEHACSTPAAASRRTNANLGHDSNETLQTLQSCANGNLKTCCSACAYHASPTSAMGLLRRAACEQCRLHATLPRSCAAKRSSAAPRQRLRKLSRAHDAQAIVTAAPVWRCKRSSRSIHWLAASLLRMQAQFDRC